MNKICKYTEHAIRRIIERGIDPNDIEIIIDKWHTIAEYPDDSPFPSFLLLGFINDKPIHIVTSIDINETIYYIITVYRPSTDIWSDDFTRRRI